jgi:hypothetical protein
MTKLLCMFLLVLAALPSQLRAQIPRCENVGTRAEGWRLPDGDQVREPCENRAAYCNAIGRRGEGWYSAPVVGALLLSQTRCANAPARLRPVCVNYGTASEGWLTQDGRMTLGSCDFRLARCDMVGSPAEGWYVLTVEPSLARLLRYRLCAYDDE